jgi:hypothetical protein
MIDRVRSVDDEPIVLVTTYLPHARVPGLEGDRPHRPIAVPDAGRALRPGDRTRPPPARIDRRVRRLRRTARGRARRPLLFLRSVTYHRRRPGDRVLRGPPPRRPDGPRGRLLVRQPPAPYLITPPRPAATPTRTHHADAQPTARQAMLAVRVHGPGDLRVDRVPLPELGDGDALLRVRRRASAPPTASSPRAARAGGGGGPARSSGTRSSRRSSCPAPRGSRSAPASPSRRTSARARARRAAAARPTSAPSTRRSASTSTAAWRRTFGSRGRPSRRAPAARPRRPPRPRRRAARAARLLRRGAAGQRPAPGRRAADRRRRA